MERACWMSPGGLGKPSIPGGNVIVMIMMVPVFTFIAILIFIFIFNNMTVIPIPKIIPGKMGLAMKPGLMSCGGGEEPRYPGLFPAPMIRASSSL